MPNTIYVAPATRGTGDGSSPSNAHAMVTKYDADWLVAQCTAWRAELDANPSDVGLNEAHTIRTVGPGIEPGYSDKSYVTDTRYGVWVRRVCFLSDVGNYVVNPGKNVFLTLPLTSLPDAGPDAGKTSGDPIKRFHFVAYRTSDGQRADQVPGGTATRSATVPVKASGADRTSTANYSAEPRQWTGATANETRTWEVTLPSPIRAVFIGNRTPDPRTGDHLRQQWCVGVLAEPVHIRDPLSAEVEPFILDGAGQRRTLDPGQVYDMDTQTTTTYPLADLGGYWCCPLGSCIGFQGFELRNIQGMFGYFSADRRNWHSFLDIRLINARYGIWRGDNICDVEIGRWQATGVSQKMLAPGKNCQRWNIHDMISHGDLCVGDHFPSLLAAANGPGGDETAYNSGAFRFERLIIEWMWDASRPSAPYLNGDGIDNEMKGYTVRDMFCDLTSDGSVDSKATPYWVNWPATAVFNAWFGRNKRGYRSWNSAQILGAVAPHILRDVTIADSRQWGMYLVGISGEHKHVDWYNPDGRANFVNPLGRVFIGMSNDNTVAGDMDVVIHQLHDARTGTKTLTAGMNTVTARGKTSPPYRAKLWTPVTAPGSMTVSVDGSTVDDGATKSTTTGTPVAFVPSGPSGATYDYTVTGGPSTVSRSGNNATVTVTN